MVRCVLLASVRRWRIMRRMAFSRDHPVFFTARRSVLRIACVGAMCAVVSGCAVTLHGHESSSGSVTTTTTSSAVSASARAGSARVQANFGTPPAPGAPGGTAVLSRGASAVLFLGLLVGDAVGYVGARLRGASGTARHAAAPTDTISQTCSCYGWTPESTEPVSAP